VKALLRPTLVAGLTALARQKPSSDPLAALQFLGTWLLEHNPSRPHTDVPAGAIADAAAWRATLAAAAAVAAQAKALRRGDAAPVPPPKQVLPPTDTVEAVGADLGAAATVVQAAFRGHLVRRGDPDHDHSAPVEAGAVTDTTPNLE
jgi:Dpy-30 motif/IQ calmodulin-binding motif